MPCVLAPQPLEALGEEEDADQVARGRRAGQLDHRAALGIQARADALAAAALPHVDQCVRRRILVLARLARDLLGHLRRQQLARRPGVGGPRGGALLERAHRALERQRHGGVDQHRLVHDLVDQAQAARGAGRDGAAGEHQVHRRRRADQARQARTAAPAGEDAELGLGQADARGGIVGRHAIAAGQRDLGAAAHAEAMDGRHGRAGQFGQLLEHHLATPDRVVDRAAAVELLELLQIGAGDEAAGLGRGDHHALGRVDGQAFDDVAQLDQHVLREGVDRGILPVQPQDDHTFRTALRAPVTESKPIEAGCHERDHPLQYGKTVMIGSLSGSRQIPTFEAPPPTGLPRAMRYFSAPNPLQQDRHAAGELFCVAAVSGSGS